VESRRRAGFREEHDRIVLANAFFNLAFSTLANGTLISIYHRHSQTEFVNADEAVAEGLLWRLSVTAGDGSSASITNRTCGEFTYSTASEQDGSLRLRLNWSGLRVGAAPVEGEVAAECLFPAHAPTALTALQVRIANHLSLQAIEFPCLCALGSSDPQAEESLFLPLSGGLLIPEPRGLLFPGETRRWEVAYPGPAAMQLLGYTCGPQATLGLGSHDPSGSEKTLLAAGMPHSNRLMLSIAGPPVRTEEGVWLPGYPLALSVVTGDWFEAAREYRGWAIEQPWCARGRGGLRNLPPLTAAQGLWVSFWGGPRAVVTVMRELQRLVSMPLKLDWRCWHGCARDGTYPDYFPPRDGYQFFSQAVRQLTEGGVLTQLSFSGLFASPDSEQWKADEAGRYTLAGEVGRPVSSSSEAGATLGSLTRMCPLTAYWREKLAGLARAAVSQGVKGVYLEDIVSSGPLRCENAGHGHGAATREQWVQSVRAFLQQVRGVLGREAHLATDGPAEAFLDLVDVMFTSHAAAEREGTFEGQFGNRWSLLPLFAAVYHSYCTLVSSGTSLANNRPYDTRWTADTIAELHEPEDLIQKGFQEQFYLEAARAVVWGEQAMLANLTFRQERDEASRRKMAFIAAALRAQTWGVGTLLPFSEFLGLLDISAPEIGVELLTNPRCSAPDDRTATRRFVVPVLGSAWRTPGAGTALVLANIHEQPVEFSASLRTSRLGLSPPLQLAGRAFSQDGDAAPAALHASGSEIAGRLPGRAVFLLSIR